MRSLSAKWPCVAPFVRTAPRGRETRPKLATRRTVLTSDAALESRRTTAEAGRAPRIVPHEPCNSAASTARAYSPVLPSSLPISRSLASAPPSLSASTTAGWCLRLCKQAVT